MAIWDVTELLKKLSVPFTTSGHTRHVNTVGPLDTAKEDQLSFCSYTGQRAVLAASGSRAGVIICQSDLAALIKPSTGRQLIFTQNPRLAFVRILNLMLESTRIRGIASSSTISNNAKVGKDCHIGEFAVIGEGCVLGDNVTIGPHAILAQNCIVGNNCIIQSGVAIGSDGFAFERHPEGKLERFAHLGYVVIEDDVEICANSSVARGSLSNTVIGSGTKIDALVHVAHNVMIGHDCELTAGTIIGGSTSIGNCCWLGLNSTLKNKIKIGNNVIVASGASVIHDVEDNDIVAGVPAKSIKHKVHTEELFLMAGQKKAETALA